MHHQIEAMLQRALKIRAGEGVVGRGQQLVLARDLADRCQVHQLEHGIGRRLHPDQPGFGADRGLDVFHIAHVDVAELQPGRFGAHAREQAVTAAVHVVAGDDMRARFQQVEDGGGGSEAGGKGVATRAAFEVGDAALVGEARGILRARVFIALVYARALLHISRSRIDRRHDRAGAGIRRLPGVNHAGGETMLAGVLHAQSSCLRR
jgi:hypothetical protein